MVPPGIVEHEKSSLLTAVPAGASSDLQQATRLARAMVTKYGMSELLGNVSIDYEDQGRSLSPETRAAVETEVCNCKTGHGCMCCHLPAAVHAFYSSLQWCMLSIAGTACVTSRLPCET